MIKSAIGIIGCGNMGGAIAKGIASSGSIPVGEVYVYDKDGDKAAKLALETGCRNGDIFQMVRGSEIILIAVKPSDFRALAERISSDIVDQTIASVMAGVTTSEIVASIGKDVPVVRAMPNLAASLKRSVTCITLNNRAMSVGNIDRVKKIFLCIGDILEVEEKQMDAVTAVSGSGPAYLFALAEAMAEAAIEEGLNEDVSRKLVSGTLLGASFLLENSELSASGLMNMVASKGGTTEAALSVLKEKGFKDIVKKAVHMAKERSSEMSRGKR